MNNIKEDIESKPLLDIDFRRHKTYYRALIPIDKLLELGNLRYGAKVKVELYIQGIGIVSKNWKLSGKYLKFHLPVKYNDKVSLEKRYRIYLLRVIEENEILERNVIVYAKGRKARIEIPKWYLDHNGIPNRETIIKVDAEINGVNKILFTRYKGSGPMIQSIPPMMKYPEKIILTSVSEYRLEDFINDFNRLSANYDKYKNIRLEYKNKLYTIIDRKKLEAREYLYSAYAYYTYLLLRIYGKEFFKTLRIHNYGDDIKIYYLQHAKKHKLTDHAAYMPLKRISYGAGKIVISYYDPRKYRISVTYLVISKSLPKRSSYINKILDETIVSDIRKIAIQLNNDTWAKKIIPLINKQKLYYKGNRKSGYHYSLGSIGEHIFYEYLRMKGYKIIKRNWQSSEHGADIMAKEDKDIWIIEVKTTTSHEKRYYKLNEALKQAQDRVSSLESNKITGIIGCSVILSTRNPICFLLYKKERL